MIQLLPMLSLIRLVRLPMQSGSHMSLVPEALKSSRDVTLQRLSWMMEIALRSKVRDLSFVSCTIAAGRR